MITPPAHFAPGDHPTAAQLNAIIDYLRRITPIGGANTSVDYTMAGCRINGTPGGSDDKTVKPFTVMKSGNDWLVYVPSGSVDLAGTTVVLEEIGTQDDWYKIQGVGSMTSFYVYAHVKGRVRFGSETVSHPAVFVSAHSASLGDTNANCAGDVKKVIVAQVDNGTVEQLWNGAITAQLPNEEPLELFWKLSAVGGAFIPWVGGSGYFYLGGSGQSFTVAETELASGGTPWSAVHLVIDCSTAIPTAAVQNSASSSSVDHRSIQLYSLNDGNVAYDTRKNLYTTIFYP